MDVSYLQLTKCLLNFDSSTHHRPLSTLSRAFTVSISHNARRSFRLASTSDIANDVYNRLVEIGNEEVTTNPEFREKLEAHFIRLPASYALDINMDRVEDVLLHQKLLILAKDPENRPVFHVRFLENFWTREDGDEDQQGLTAGLTLSQARCLVR